MKIYYSKKRLNKNLVFAVVWTVLGLLNLKYFDGNDWLDFGYLLVAVLYWGSYFYEKTKQYLIIENEQIGKNYPFAKKINLSDITSIKRSGRDYILQTEKDKLIINTELITENSLQDLKQILEKLDLPPEKTPFAIT